MNPSRRLISLLPRSLTAWILVAALVGVVVGLGAPQLAAQLQFLSTLFLRFIRSIIAPLLVAVLIRAIAGAGSLGSLGRLGWKSIVVFEIATSIALLLGWGAALIVQPGRGFSIESKGAELVVPASLMETIENAVPVSIIDAMARGDILQIVIFSLLFGIACLSVGERARPIVEFADAMAEVAFRYTDFVMWLAPLAVFSAVADTVAKSGADGFGGLANFVATAWIVQSLFALIVIGGGLSLFQISCRRFWFYAREPFLVALATTSSAAALPQLLENLQLFGVPKRILGVVAPLSLSLNANGSVIHLGMATLFVAQAAQIDLSWTQQLAILLTLKLTSKGVAGVPRANFIILAAVFESYGLPLAGLTVLLGVDALVDPVRTSVNVLSHCAAPSVIARWEGYQFPER